ncbi:MAG: ferritin-like domain-containing protein, partial [Actinomycetota bacterium]|nr:ferritin-like domain-containing protein [Actinomycetota bacterium]
APDYELPFPVADAGAARRLAVHLEKGTAAAWHFALGALAAADLRRLAVTALTDAATRGLQWRLGVPGEPSTVPFPGT